jgi:hypothetical protein
LCKKGTLQKTEGQASFRSVSIEIQADSIDTEGETTRRIPASLRPP